VLLFFLGDFLDAWIILGVVIVNSSVGIVQEGKAENTLDALQKYIKSYAHVLRDGIEITIEDSELVAGDIILLKDGSLIPADARLIESNELKLNQSSLTGESEPVIKNGNNIPAVGINFNEQHNMVFRGTYVISGLAKAIVVRTGTKTLIGQISKKLGEVNSDIPLKRKINKLANIILVVVGIVSILIFVFGVYRGNDLNEMLLTVVAISVSAIPESLPLIVTLVLASGVGRMSKKKVLVKRLQAVEALGQASVLAIDKTGTITKNQMTVAEVYVNNRYIKVTGDGYVNKGLFIDSGEEIKINNDLEGRHLIDNDLDLIGKISTFTSIADFNRSDPENWHLDMGDPTEAALKILGEKMGMTKNEMENKFPKVLEIPFSFKTKYHATVNKVDNKYMLSVAGSPEIILDKCDSIWQDGKRMKMSIMERKKLEAVINQLSANGYRILALAADLDHPKNCGMDKVRNLTFVGFTGIIDAIRPGVYDSVKKAKAANMKVVMITGDHAKTAQSIASKVGIYASGDLVMTGNEIDHLSDEALMNVIGKVSVFARVSPDNKLRIIKTYKMNGEIVAMTGDGINDALSLVAADLGVAMGQNGTEVAREAADIILTDDNFGNIISAAEEGRNIYWIIRKSILYLLSTNTGELSVILVAVVIGLPIPLLATQIIWMNLVTDTFMVAALTTDPKEDDLMNDRYRRSGNNIIDRMMITRIIMVATLMTFATLYLFVGYLDGPMEKAWTISLTTLSVFQWFNIFSIKSHHRTIFSRKTFNNKFLLLGLFVAVSLHSFAIYTPFMQKALRTTGLSGSEWITIILIASTAVMAEEIRKIFYRKWYMKPAF
jgi:Ca2+-transporting ATPase